MKLIAHRGLTQGPNKDLENNPDQILKAKNQGYDCEIDLWKINADLWLGHDAPQYPISQKFLDRNYESIWIHAKNLNALYFLTGGLSVRIYTGPATFTTSTETPNISDTSEVDKFCP